MIDSAPRPPRPSRRTRTAAAAAALLLSAASCERRDQDTFEDAGTRLDRAIKRVEDAKTELREAEAELAAARAELGQKVETVRPTTTLPPEEPPAPAPEGQP